MMTCKVRTRCEQDVQYQEEQDQQGDWEEQDQQADWQTHTHTHNEIDKTIMNAHLTTPLNMMISV